MAYVDRALLKIAFYKGYCTIYSDYYITEQAKHQVANEFNLPLNKVKEEVQMKTFEATVMVRNGNANIAHTARVTAQTSFSAREMLSAQYGANNVVTMPVEVSSSGSSYDPAPWMQGFR